MLGRRLETNDDSRTLDNILTDFDKMRDENEKRVLQAAQRYDKLENECNLTEKRLVTVLMVHLLFSIIKMVIQNCILKDVILIIFRSSNKNIVCPLGVHDKAE